MKKLIKDLISKHSRAWAFKFGIILSWGFILLILGISLLSFGIIALLFIYFG